MATDDKKTGANGAGKQKTITLSTGQVASLRKAKGRDLEQGAAVAANPTNPMSLMMGVAAQVTTIDGKSVLYEDVREMDMMDVMELIGELAGKNVLSQLSAINS